MASHSTLTTSYRSRARLPATSPLASYLLRLVSIKQSNLCLSADVDTSAELLRLAEDVGDSICLLKTHCDMITDWTDRTAQALKEIARRKRFLIFEDRKFADIGETVQKQYASGHHRIALWADITNAHVLPGPAIVDALQKAADATIAKYNTTVHTEISADPRSYQVNGFDEDDDDDDSDNDKEPDKPAEAHGDWVIESPIEFESDDRRLGCSRVMDRKHSVVSVTTSISMRTESISPRPEPDSFGDTDVQLDAAAELVRLGEAPFLRSLLLLAEMSSEGHLMTPEYQKRTLEIARDHADFVMGFIAQRSLNTEPGDNFITMTPGCQLSPPGQEAKKLGDALGQQYNTPHKLVFEQGCDIIIVGRGIVRAANTRAEAERYRTEAWKAYEERIGKVK